MLLSPKPDQELIYLGEREQVQATPLIGRRKLLGYAIPLVNGPLFLWNLYETARAVQGGLSMNSSEFIQLAVILASNLLLTVFIPRSFPVYPSSYAYTGEGLELKRFLKRTVTLPYAGIARAELFLRVDQELSDDARKYTSESSSGLRRSGFRFKDFSNSEDKVLNLFMGKDIYMISPTAPKSMIKELKRRNPRMSAKIVELTARGKSVRELGK